MPILPDYEYDIFISYRHNDNRSGWVTEFVNALREELAATIKVPLTIYFDQNPHDGLLETHNIDKSLEGKLKCLIFIPIVSQTYCDTKSFAWQHEFVAFNKLAKEDLFGRDIKLSNGNVASRILPIKIHELDAEDKSLIESEIGGVLRAIEFIFKSAGVNRPLTSFDKREENVNKTLYRDQANKVANAVKEIITALKNSSSTVAQTIRIQQPVSSIKTNSTKKKSVIISLIVLLIAVFGYFFYQQPAYRTGRRTTNNQQPTQRDKSIAVLPFVDLSEQKDQGWFGDGLTEEILNSLAHVKGLNVTSRTSSFAFKNKNLRIQDIADSLGVNYIVEGSIRKSENGLRITAQLIRASDGFHVWSNTYDRDAKAIFDLQKEIATKIAESLDISLDVKAIEQMLWAGTTSAEAYLAFLKARALDNQAHERSRFVDLATLKKANSYYEQSSQLDPDFVNPYLFHADFFLHYVLKDDPNYQDTLTDQQAYNFFNADLANAIERSKEVSQSDYYRIPQTMYSNNWSNFRQVIEKGLLSEDAPRLFKYQNFDFSTLLIALGYGKELSEISRKIQLQDPSTDDASRIIIFNLLHSGKYEEVLSETAKANLSPVRYGMDDYKLFAMIQLGKLEEAYDMIMQDPNQDYFTYYDLKAIIFAKQGKLEEAKKFAKITHRSSPFYLFAVDAVLGRQEANKEAALMDKKILLDFPLFRSLFLSPNNLPYDLSATPNFARKLKQAGVNVNQK